MRVPLIFETGSFGYSFISIAHQNKCIILLRAIINHSSSQISSESLPISGFDLIVEINHIHVNDEQRFSTQIKPHIK